MLLTVFSFLISKHAGNKYLNSYHFVFHSFCWGHVYLRFKTIVTYTTVYPLKFQICIRYHCIICLALNSADQNDDEWKSCWSLATSACHMNSQLSWRVVGTYIPPECDITGLSFWDWSTWRVPIISFTRIQTLKAILYPCLDMLQCCKVQLT